MSYGSFKVVTRLIKGQVYLCEKDNRAFDWLPIFSVHTEAFTYVWGVQFILFEMFNGMKIMSHCFTQTY